MSASPDSLFREIRSSDVFADLATELGDRFHDEGYKNSRIPDIKADFQQQAEEAGVPEDAAASVAGRLIGALMQEAKDQAPPSPRSKWDRLDPGEGPLSEERDVDLPGPMYHLLRLIGAESSPFRQVHRLIDAIEWAVKWHTTLALSDLLAQGDIPKSVKLLLARSLQTPSLGTWHRFFREAVAAFDAVETTPALSWNRFERLTGLEDEHNLVNFRNKYAHGATPNDDECQRDVEQFLPVLRELVHSPLFTGIRLAVRSEGDAAPHVLRGPKRTPVDANVPPGHAVALLPEVAERSIIDLWPLGIARLSDADTGPVQKGETQFFFFNALKHNEVDQLNYEGPLHYRDSSLYDPFLQRLPLRAWRQAAGPDLDDVTEQVEALTDTFKGRREERARLRGFVANGEGTLMVFGAPGIGKSTLLAQVVKEVEAGIDADGRPLTGNDGKSIDPPPVIAYFIRRAEGSDNPVTLLRSLCRQFDRRYGVQGIGMGNESVTLQENLRARLQAIQDQASGTPERTVLLIDGLDEATDLGQHIPAARGWLPVIVASRETPEAESFYESRHRETRSRMTLGPMGTADVRAMLYDGVSKYDPDFTEAYVEAVAERSEGNPLYLKLLVEALFQGEMTVGDVSALPSEMGTMYRTAVRRVTDGGTNQDAVDLLHLLAAAKAPLPPDALGELLGINSMRADAAVHATKELLREAPPETLYPTSEDAPEEAVQLFHDSLREWLQEAHAAGCQAMRDHLAKMTAEWDKRQNETARRYALRYGAVHQRTAERPDALWKLLSDPTYRNAQVNAFKQYDATYDAMQHGLDVYATQNGATPESDVRLARLTLDAGIVSQEAQEDVTQAFRWAEAGRMNDALQRIEVLGEEKYFLAILRLLWIEADRQAKRPEAEQVSEKAIDVLDALDDRIPSGTEAINWSKFAHPDFITWWVERVLATFPDLGISGILSRTDDYSCGKVVKQICEKIINDSNHKRKLNNNFIDSILLNIKYYVYVLGLINFLLYIIQNIKNKLVYCKSASIIALSLFKIGYKKESQLFFEDAYTITQTIEDSKARDESFESLSSALAKAGQLDTVSAIIKMIDSDWMSAIAHGNLAFAQAKEGNIDEAYATTQEIEGEIGYAIALSKLATGLAKGRYEQQSRSTFEKARTAASTIVSDEVRTIELSNLASDLAEAGYTRQSQLVFDQIHLTVRAIRSNEERARTLTRLATILSEAGHIERAKSVLEEAGATLLMMRSNWMSTNVIEGIAYAQVKARRLGEALNTARAIKRECARSKVLTALAGALVHENHEQAQVIFVEALSTSKEIKRDWMRAEVLAALIENLVEAGDYEHAQSVLDNARTTAKIIESDSYLATALGKLATALAKAGLFDEARSTAKSIQDDLTRARVLAVLAEALVEAEDHEHAQSVFDETLTTANTIEDDLTRARVLVVLAKTFVEAGDHEHAQAVFNEALTTAKAVKHNWMRAKMLVVLAGAVVQVGDDAHAQSVLDEALSTVNSFEDSLTRTRVLAVLAEALVEAGDDEHAQSVLDKARTTAKIIESESYPDTALGKLATALAKAGLFDEARSTAKSIQDDLTRAEALSDISTARIKTGDDKQARLVLNEAQATVQTIRTSQRRAKALEALATAFAKAGYAEQAVVVTMSIADLSGRADTIQSVVNQNFQSGSPETLATHLPTLDLTKDGWTNVLHSWREGLLEHVADPRSLLRESLTLYPFDQKSAVEGVYALVQGHVQADDLDTAGAIAAACPELQLDVLVTESERPPLPDDCDPETLPDSFRAKFDSLVAAHANGEMDDATFTAKAEVIFEMAAL
ncbi:ATP-binding protein [Salisaeta longa]|uniref:ATP-binding protein n=1 Tax=Salisaeta longa TaxID=503170 RepID=UPI0003B477BD|nr:ATP-binding protein [Salisaeta longa]